MSALWLFILAIIVLLVGLTTFVTWWLWQDEREWQEGEDR